jgi:hypothetical protein
VTPEQAKALRADFPTNAVGKLPRVTCRLCRKAQDKVCPEHRQARCGVCKGFLTTQHIHLDFVGHAETTDRLLSVDPEWTWEPMAFGEDGLPAYDEWGGLWIRLTVAGVTRPGYGAAETSERKTPPDMIKEAIGDAIRNAAMRYGVALGLWGAKGVPDDDTADHAPQTAQGASSADSDRASVLRRQIAAEAQAKGYSLGSTEAVFREHMRTDIRSASVPLLAEFLAKVENWPTAGDAA